MNTSTTSAVQTHTPQSSQTSQPKKAVQGEKLRGYDKVARIPIKIIPTETAPQHPDRIRVNQAEPGEDEALKKTMRSKKHHGHGVKICGHHLSRQR